MSIARLALILAGGMAAFFIFVSGLLTVLSTQMIDPLSERHVATLEFVAIDADDARCILNREDVAAGVHDFWVITEGSGATLELRDETGNAVFRSEDPQGLGVVEGSESDTALKLEEGRYTLVCRYPDGAEGEATLDVTAD